MSSGDSNIARSHTFFTHPHIHRPVPDSFPGETKETGCCWGGSFPSVSYVEPSGADFANIMGRYITRYCAEYGCHEHEANYWQTDLYNELSPPSSDTDYLRSASSAVYAAMNAADKNAVWVTQGWMFYSDSSFWQGWFDLRHASITPPERITSPHPLCLTIW